MGGVTRREKQRGPEVLIAVERGGARPGRRTSTEDILSDLERILTSDDATLSTMLLRDMIANVLKLKRDQLDVLDLKILRRAMAEFRYAASVFKPYRGVRKVSIFGSARTPSGDPYYEMGVRFGRLLAENGFMVITGAAEGIMKAGIEGAGAENSFGANILLPAEQSPNEIILDDPKLAPTSCCPPSRVPTRSLITFRYFFTRKIFFLMEAHAVALFPGGFGTHDEAFETLTLLQTGKSPLLPLLLMELPGENYWEEWDGFVRRQLLGRGLISEEDLSLYRTVYTPEEGLEWIQFFYSTYHSMRRVRDKLSIRLERSLGDEQIRELNGAFGDLIREGSIERSDALPDEADEPGLADKPRVVFSYNDASAGRLVQLVLRINEMGAVA